MKKYLAILLMILTLTACSSSTPYGDCVGIGDEDSRDPTLHYKLSAWNLAMGVIFFELIVPPIVLLGRSDDHNWHLSLYS